MSSQIRHGQRTSADVSQVSHSQHGNRLPCAGRAMLQSKYELRQSRPFAKGSYSLNKLLLFDFILHSRMTSSGSSALISHVEEH